MYQAASANSGLPVGEVGAGWIWHIFNDATLKVIPKKSLRDLDDFYRAVNSELELAFQRGLIRKRFVVHPLLGGNPVEILSGLPKSLLKVSQDTFHSAPFVADQAYEKELFDRVCWRRSALVYAPEYVNLVQGWAFPDLRGSTILDVKIGVFESANGVDKEHWISTVRLSRPDVESAFAAEGRRLIDPYGFRAQQLLQGRADKVVVRYFMADGTVFTSTPLKANTVTRVKQLGVENFIMQGIDATGPMQPVEAPNARRNLQTTLIAVVAGAFGYLFVSLIVLALAVRLISKFKGLAAPWDNTKLVVLGLVVGILLQRLFFYAVVDVAAWDTEIRYLASAAVLLPLVFALLMAYLFDVVKPWFPGKLA